MAKPFIVDEAEGARFPFLRGILTRSLQAAGLSFEDSYHLASAIRSELDDRSEITTAELRARVIEHLAPFGDEVIRRYKGHPAPPRILIRFADGHTTPFSRGRHRMALRSCGLTTEQAATVAAKVFADLAARNDREIEFSALKHMTHRCIQSEVGDQAARQYVVREQFQKSDRPLVVLIGGAVGSGKSTVATQTASRLGIVRIQSLDMLREVMRIMVPERLLPVLHTSSFRAWEKLPPSPGASEDADARLINGYLAQAQLLSVACEAVIERALKERVSIILEGVNVDPGLVEHVAEDTDAIVVRIMLAVLSPRQLRSRLRGRGQEAPGRRGKRYLKYFDAIWRLQSFLLSEADRVHVPIVANDDLDDAVDQVMGIVMTTLAASFAGTAEEVFH